MFVWVWNPFSNTEGGIWAEGSRECGFEEVIWAQEERGNRELYYLHSLHNIIRVTKRNEMVGACGTFGRQESCLRDFGGETWRKETTLKTGA